MNIGMIRLINVILLLYLTPLLCKGENTTSNFQLLWGEPLDGIRIAWDFSSIQKIADKGGYPRLLRMQDSTLVIIYEDRQGNIRYKRSYDNGASWDDAVEVFSRFKYTANDGKTVMVNIANPEIVQLQNGDIIIGCNYRPSEAEIAPYSIAIRRSTDNGKTWLAPQVLYDAAPRFHDGCWEPAFLQLPDGRLQVYFANENPYQQSDEQEISMLSSLDNGNTWTTEPKTVSFRKDRRDGMPVPRIVEDEIVVIIEDNNVDRFKPYTVRTKISDDWINPVLADSPEREYALTERIADSAYLGAPYFLKLPTGETVISYQTNENRNADWELSTMEVAVGDKTARHFAKRTQPFSVPLDKETKWNSLALWDDDTIVAVASTNFASPHVAPYIIKGYIIPEITAEDKSVSGYPIFIGAKGETNLRAGVANDDGAFHIVCKVNDGNLYGAGKDSEKSNGVYIYIGNNDSSSENSAYKLWCDYRGNAKVWKYSNRNWEAVSGDGVEIVSTIDENGYELLLSMSKKYFTQLNEKEIRLNIVLSAYESEHSGYTEPIANSDVTVPGSWLKIRLN
jgi:hypothetical protein